MTTAAKRAAIMAAIDTGAVLIAALIIFLAWAALTTCGGH